MGSTRFLLTVHKNCLQVTGIKYNVVKENGRRKCVPKRSKLHEFPMKNVSKEDMVMIRRKFFKHIWNPIRDRDKNSSEPLVKIKYWRHRPQALKFGAETSASLTASTHHVEVLMAWALDPKLRPDACKMRDSVLLDYSPVARAVDQLGQCSCDSLQKTDSEADGHGE